MHRRVLSLVVGALILLPASASAVTAVSPINDDVADLHPVLTWSLDPGEQSNSVTIAKSPATTPVGDFFDESQVAFGLPTGNATTWAPTEPQMAGTYWWIVTAFDASFNETRTAPQQFHIDAVLQNAHFRVDKFRFLRQLSFSARWTTNAPSVLVTFRVSRNGRTLWKRSKRSQ